MSEPSKPTVELEGDVYLSHTERFGVVVGDVAVVVIKRGRGHTRKGIQHKQNQPKGRPRHIQEPVEKIPRERPRKKREPVEKRPRGRPNKWTECNMAEKLKYKTKDREYWKYTRST